MENILVLGEGCREHCICESLNKSEQIDKVYLFPGNNVSCIDGIFRATIQNNDFKSIFEFCKKENVNYVFPSSENYLCGGIVDYFEESEGIKCFGPSKEASKLESCKIYSKNLMRVYNIPTPYFRTFDNTEDAKEYLTCVKYENIVIKNPNLAKGKGVYLPDSLEETNQILEKEKEVIVEERIFGEEVSILGFCNGKNITLMPQSKDYKKIYEGEKGPNTGGMGAVSPVNILTEEELNKVKKYMEKIVQDLNYKGILYAGLMKTKENVYFLEFNCRFGDPETQVLLNLLDTDLFEIVKKCIQGDEVKCNWKSGNCMTLVLSHFDYPQSKSKESFPLNLENVIDNVKIYYGNIQKRENNIYSNGGRILNLTSYSESHYQNFINLYNNARTLEYQDKYYRRDIGLELFRKSNRKLKIAILGSTRGTSVQKLLDHYKDLNLNIEIIIVNRKDSYLLKRGLEKAINTIYLNSRKYKNNEEYDTTLINILKIFDIDLILLVGYMKILSKKFVDEYKGKIINVHPSLLPHHEGLMDMEVHDRVINPREKISGCTFHYVTEEVDRGEIILQKSYILKEDDTSESLKKEIQKLESDGLIEAINIFRERKIDYAFSGVNIDEGNKVVTAIKNIDSQLNKDIGGFGNIYNYNGINFASSTDGIGSKLDLAISEKSYETIGIDLVAMVVNDLYCCGAKPLFFLDYFAIDKVDKEKCEKVIRGINKGCQISNCKLVGGETAEMPSLYFKDKFDIGGFGVGVVENEFPRKISEGDLIYGIKSSGIHSNGYSLVRKLLKYSEYDMEKILTPTRIYHEIPEIIEKYGENLLGICHITGGGIVENLPRILPKDKSFEINDWEFPEVFKWIQKESHLSKEEMLRVFNCGYGMILVFKKGSIISDEFDYLGKIKS